MTTLPRSLSKGLFLFLAMTAVVSAAEYCPREFEVLERGKKDNVSFQKRKLEKLFCNESFEGEHFKIVYATEDEAIRFDNKNEALKKKAANVYHHLTVARNYWINSVKSDYVAKLPQIVVRLDITNAFSSTRQFKNAEQEKNYNNALTIPEGKTPRSAKEQRSWGKEIWFSPSKKIESRKEMKSEGNNPVHESLVLIKDPIVEYNKNGLIYMGLSFLASPQIYDGAVLNSALQRLGAIAIVYGLIEASRHMDKIFVNKYYYVDTAMVPEVIYHEFAHIALSDTMKTVHSVPVIEGMADYFATRVADRRKMYEEIKNYSTNRYKDRSSKDYYHPYLEGYWNATSDFTLSLLWAGKTEFDKINEVRAKRGHAPIADYDQLIFETHFRLTEDSDIMNDLNRALIDTCVEKCSETRTGVNTLNRVFEKKGFN